MYIVHAIIMFMSKGGVITPGKSLGQSLPPKP